ncbi:RICIN domain-containing protein [Kitasatospora sp. NPDC096147]|uniref:RICIN domain-containing protein n=1 Tax=Kitasatospora sp. NPDC096147 TaxID=3364093 RepID=UPI003809938D
MISKWFAGRPATVLGSTAALAALALGTAPTADAAGMSFGPYALRNLATGKCADLPGYGPGRADGPVNQYDCNRTTADNQLFRLDYLSSDYGSWTFTVRNTKDNLCLDVPDYGPVPAGTRVSEYVCDGSGLDNQQFRLVARSTGGSWIVNVASGLCLDVDGVRTGGNDARLTLYPCSDADDHAWELVDPQ